LVVPLFLPAAVAASSAIAAVAIPSSSSSATAATTAAASTAPAPSKASAPSPAPSAAPALSRWPRFIDHNIPAHEIVAIQPLNGALGFFIAIDFDKPEPAWLARETVAHQGYIRCSHSRLRKQSCNLFFRSLKRQVTDIKFLQRETPSGRGSTDPRNRD
jgi:hypothetical protein